MKVLYLTIIYPSGTEVHREIDAWPVFIGSPQPAFEQIWLCEGQKEDIATCDVTADRILIWERP